MAKTMISDRASSTRLPRLTIALAVALALGGNAASAQVVNFRHYTSANGLPQAQVNSIRQDRLGYLWFATYGGLSRFDGAEFHTYTKHDGLTSNSVFDIVEDSAGRLLIATSGGLCIREKGQFRCIRQTDGLVNDNARNVALDRSGGIWVGTARGLSHVKGNSIRNYTTAEGLPAERVVRVAVDSLQRVWVATQKGLARLEGERFVLDSPHVIGDTAVQFVAPMGAGVLVGLEGRLYHRAGDSIRPIARGAMPEGVRFTDGAVDRDGTIWLGSREGVVRIREDRVERLGVANGLQTELINRVAFDRDGNVWFGTESGASKHVPGPFRTYTASEGLPNAFVRAIAVGEMGELWMGTRNGVAVRDGERFKEIRLPADLPDNRVYGLAREPRDGMLIGTRRGLVWYSSKGARLYREDDGLPGDVIFCLLDDGDGGVWIGTDRGLARWKNGTITTVDRPEISKLSIISMTRDSRGRLWLGRQEGGVAIVDGDSVRFIGAAEGASDQTIWALREDRQGHMWVGTNGDGALRIDSTGIRRFTTTDGLASDFIWQVLPDSRGDVWLFGNLGLDRFTGPRLTHYGRGSGLIELEGSAGAALEDPDGNLWFGTGLGVVRYVRGLDIPPSVVPPVFIESATHDSKPIDFATTQGATFSRGAIRIGFSSPSFRDETATRFRLRLVGGANASWSTPTTERSITYDALSPGSYRFEVMAMNGGVESASPASFAFTVSPAFWQTWWFRLLAVALLVGATGAVPSLRARALEQERRRLEALVAQHTRELAEKNARLEQSNRDLEHFAYIASHDLQEPLRKIQAFSDRVAKQYAEKLDEQGADYLGRMGSAAARMQRLIEDLLSLSRVTTKRNPIEPIDLNAIAEEVLGDLEYRIQSTRGRVELGELPFVHADPVQIRQVFQNLIGNALKFHRAEEAPLVRVTSVTKDANTVEIHFEDNGIGFETKDAEKVFVPFLRLHGRNEYEGTGIGLTICQKIAERHGGTIRAESTPGRGSRFVVVLPIHGPVGERHAA
jgi:signal transduction histidine kinase/ligand-binding sensor domain-containing protein